MRRAAVALAAGVVFYFLGLRLGLFNDSMAFHIAASLGRAVLGFSVSVALSFAVSVALGAALTVRAACKPLFAFLTAIPTITWVPLLLVTTGLSERTIVLSIVLGSLFPMVYSMLEGFDTVPRNEIRAARILGFSGVRLYAQFYVPASFNGILAGLKLGVAYAWRSLVGAEMLTTIAHGLGVAAFAARRFYDQKLMFSSVLFIGLLGYVIKSIFVEGLEERTIRKWGIS